MKVLIGLSTLFALICVPLSTRNFISENNSDGLGIAYAASYTTDFRDEPQYETQNNKTYSYLALGNTLDTYRGDAVKVGIIDSGCNYDHEDFMVSGQTKVQDESRYYKYETNKWVYYSPKLHGYSYIDDSLGHGTNVAATVASSINSIGGFGIAPNVELYVYKVTNSNNGYEFGAIQLALNEAIERGIDVINMSFQSYEHDVTYGGVTQKASTGCSTVLSSFINKAYNAGITLVGAAGNFNTDEPSYPGSNNNVINVGSFSSTDKNTKAAFSNYGTTIDLVAPGYVHVAGKGDNDNYVDTSGTSFSAPLVTGAIALYKQKNPDATPSEIEQALYDSCDSIEETSWAGHGSLNVSRFLGLDVLPESVSVSLDKSTIKVGETTKAIANVLPAEASDKSVTWSSSNANVATIDDKGIITATGIGSTTIKAVTKTGSKEGTATLYVEEGYVGYVVQPEEVSITLNETCQLNVYGEYSSGERELIDSSECLFDSEGTDICTISDSGLISPVGVGQTRVTVMTPDEDFHDITVSVVKTPIDKGNAEILKNSFSTTSGDLDSYLSYKAYKGNGTTDPKITNNSIRLYQNSSGKYGGYVQITASNNRKIRSIVFQTGTATKYGHGSSTTSLINEGEISANTDIIITGLNNSSYIICNFGTTDKMRLDLSKLVVYYWDQEVEAKEWCQTFIDTLDCDPTGKKQPSQTIWNDLGVEFDKLSSDAQDLLKTAESSPEKTSVIGFAMNNYDLVLSKYGPVDYPNFINRVVKSDNHSKSIINNGETIIPIVVVISLISVSTISYLVLIKKRKEK